MTFMRKLLDVLRMDDNTELNQIAIPDEDTILNNICTIIPEQNIMDTSENRHSESIYSVENVVEETAPTPIKREPKRAHMSKYDIERYAIECNAYVVREERKSKNND